MRIALLEVLSVLVKTLRYFQLRTVPGYPEVQATTRFTTGPGIPVKLIFDRFNQ
jgi:hypothetical protein